MSKFNSGVTGSPLNKTLNKAGGIAYKEIKEMELLSSVVSGFMDDTYYETGKDRIERIKTLVSDLAVSNPVFLLGLAEKVRSEYHMRSASHVLVAEITKLLKGDKYKLSDFVSNSIERVDDISEIIAYLLPHGKKNKKEKTGAISHSLIKGIKKAFEKFDDYQLAKYNRDTSINLKDVVRLAHVGGENAKKILNDKLTTPETWEVEISKISKKSPDYYNEIFNAWEKLVNDHKLGYMATLRNLRNIMTACDDMKKIDTGSNDKANKLIDSVCDYLTNESAVLKSKQLPFRFLSAYNQIEHAEDKNSVYKKQLLKAIEQAGTFSIKNLEIKGDTAVFADVSGSMEKKISAESTTRMIDIGLLFAGMADKISKRGVSGVFGDLAKIKPSGDSIFSQVKSYKEGEVGYATYGHKAIELLTNDKIKVDNIMLFTDTEIYSEPLSNNRRTNGNDGVKAEINVALENYRKNINKDVKVYIFNLAGNGTKISNHDNVYTISGWSDKIFEYIKIIDSFDNNTIVKEIEDNGKKYIR